MKAIVCLLAAALLSGCRDARSEQKRGTVAPVAAAPAASDSIYSTERMLAQFRANLKEHPTQLGNAAADLRDLVKRFAEGVAENDTTRLLGLQLSPAEFAYLYYPDNPFSKKPYELDPQTMWFQISARSGGGFGRLMRAYGGKRMEISKVDCGEPLKHGQNRVYARCLLSLKENGRTESRVLFGTVVERGGRYKLVSYANQLD